MRVAPRLAPGALLFAVCLTGWSAPIRAQGASQSAAIPDLSGGWLLLDAEGSGSFDGTAQRFPPAELTASEMPDIRPRSLVLKSLPALTPGISVVNWRKFRPLSGSSRTCSPVTSPATSPPTVWTAIGKGGRPSYAVYCAIAFVSFASLTWPISVPRYVMGAFPIFIAMAHLARRRWATGPARLPSSCSAAP